MELMMNNEPVAWIWTCSEDGDKEYLTRAEPRGTTSKIPLYTHPAKTLTPLTDEEILKEWTWKYSDCFEDFLLQFAKAILRKSQEKC